MTATTPKMVQRDDVAVYYNLSSQMQKDEFDTYVIAAQTVDLPFYLGEVLTYELLNNYRDSGDYQTLFNGTTYEYETGKTRYFHGVKPLLIYYIIQRIIDNSFLKSTGSGIVKKKVHNSDQIEQKERERIHAEIRSRIFTYYNSLMMYLEKNSTTFPNWIGKQNFVKHVN